MSLVPVQHQAVPFDVLLRQADVLAQSRIIPRAYQGRSSDVVAAGLAGASFGWDVMTSMRNYHVIEGTASLRPEAMLGLVRRYGHSVSIEVVADPNTGKTAVAKGTRADNGDSYTARFSEIDAKNAGLAGKKNWSQYLDTMLTWRAVSQLCRFLFSDVVLGAGYVPEEIGAEVGADGTPTDDPFTTMVSASQAKHALLEACQGDKQRAVQAWGDLGSEPIAQQDLDALIASVLPSAEPEEEIEEAEIVPPKRASLGSRAKKTEPTLSEDEAVTLINETFTSGGTE